MNLAPIAEDDVMEIASDDELEILGDYSHPNDKILDDVKQSAKPKKVGKRISEVWQYFEKLEGAEKCKCNGCSKVLSSKSSGGTKHLWRHHERCGLSPTYENVGLMLDNKATLLKKWKFDSTAYREALSKAIIKHDLPFSYAEYDGVSVVNKVLNPEYQPISRNTAKEDCMGVFLSEKDKLKSVLASIPSRICLTSDVWTAVTTQGYMTVTAHYIDHDRKLNSKLLSFCHLEASHTGLELSGKVLEALKDWGIASKIFSITLDNATSNDSMVSFLKDRLNLQDALLSKGKYFHVRCCAHILNLIVQDGLKAVGDALHKIRASVKYVKISEGRLRDFRACIKEVHLDGISGGFLRMDVSTRWNATYMMLESAIKYRRAFINLSFNDKNYKMCPSLEEWDRAEKICAFLAPFYTITNLMSGSSYPTANLYFTQVALIEMGLKENLNSEDVVIKNMATLMKLKFDKYWTEYSVNLALGCVFDPTSKFDFINFCFKRLYPTEYEDKVNKLKESLYAVFSEYTDTTSALPSSLARSSRHIQSSISSSSVLEEFNEERRKKTSNAGKSQLEIYLNEPCLDVNDIDVLQYWKINKSRFPQLAIMACDFLSIPITTVASESSFSIGGRILTKYRNSLLPETVQALICTRNWLHGYKEVGPTDMPELVEEIKLSD